ncbi:MAG: hypothetical protein ACPGJV_00110 [Bacteriovoracaceae bacterium]
MRRKKNKANKAQLEFDFERKREPDRNHHLGGRSFYFFDFDDNVAYLSTPIVIFHKKDGKEKFISSGEFARDGKKIGLGGHYKDFFLNFDDDKGSFRYFRDQEFNFFDRLKGKRQTFVQDISKALDQKDYHWKAPSWNCFYHATFNKRPMSIITARGHENNTIKQGINLMVKSGHLPNNPNYLSIYPVSNPTTRRSLGDIDLQSSVAELKRSAIRQSVEAAIKKYGHSPHHRFGMSDDDPKNVELITEEMRELKRKYSDMAFFVFHTHENSFERYEIKYHSTRRKRATTEREAQMSLI